MKTPLFLNNAVHRFKRVNPQILARAVTCSFVLVTLVSCTNMAPPAVVNSDWAPLGDKLKNLDSWQLRGRVNVRYNNDSNTPRIQWMQQNTEYHIRLWGTFNAGNTVIVGRPGFVTLEQGGDVLTASSPEDLILQQLGYELPVSYLEHWIKGIPSPESRAELNFNELNQLTSLVQDGWTVSYSDLRQYDSIALPRRVEVTRPKNDIRLRFVGLNWNLEADDQ